MSQDQVAATFDAWAAEGRDASMEQGHQDVVQQVVAGMEIRAGEKILDLGCGNGWATRLLAKSAAGTQAIGIDVSPQMIARADELHSFTIRARYDLGNFEALDFPDDHFDRAFSMEALYYTTDLDASLSELRRVLKPGGRIDLVLDFYDERADSAAWPGQVGIPMQRHSEAGWSDLLRKAGFEAVAASRVVDRRGPGEESEFTPSVWYPDWEAKVEAHRAGSLHLSASSPK